MDTDEVKEKLVTCLSEQINEIESLKSMYSKKNEMVFDNPSILQRITEFLDNKTTNTPEDVDFTLNLHEDNVKLEVCVHLPIFYPEVEPNIYVRCNELSRQEESRLNAGVKTFIKDNHVGAVCLYDVVVWLQDNVGKHRDEAVTENVNNNKKAPTDEKFSRYWIYSHHIYNKKKREEIFKTAKDLNLTGFCLIGKPGIIYIEGLHVDCQEYWRIIKSLTWKSITVRKTVTYELSERLKEQRFRNFELINFNNSSSVNSHQPNKTQLSTYIEKYSLANEFKEVFGF